jgi:WD40 repeat protein
METAAALWQSPKWQYKQRCQMQSNQFFKQVLYVSSFLFLSLAACAPGQETVVSSSIPSPTPGIVPTEMPIPTATPLAKKPVLVAYAKDGDIQLWNSETNQSHTLLRAGDVTSIMMSDDGQVIAFIRRSLFFEPELLERNSLWAVDRNGENPRELVSNETLRQILNPPAADSAGFAQMSWIPGTHRIVYSGVKFYAPGQGFTNSKDIYLVDADTRSNMVLAPDIMPDTFINAWRFLISPDGQQIALFTNTELSFINIDGSNWRKAVLTYPSVGVGDAVLLPGGVWTQDSRTFIFTGPIQSDSRFVLNYTIWRVPVDGSPAQSLASITNSHSSSVTFSPDGQQMSFLHDTDGTIQDTDWQIMPLPADVDSLAIPHSLELFYANPHWSPGGDAFVIKDQNLFRLCANATDSSQVCGNPIHLKSDSDIINWIQWVADDRFLYTGLEPATLFLGNLDGTITPIVTWTENDMLPGWSFYIPQ